MNSNNPYRHAAQLYETNLRMPVVSRIRRDEARVVGELLARYSDGKGRALEIGPGTGFYTVALARSFGEVTAVEEAPQMVTILERKLAAAGVGNVRVEQGDFRRLPLDGQFDVAVAIGVLDYIAEPAEFVAKMCAAARRAVIVTAPQRGLLGRCFVAGGAMRKTRVYCYEREAIANWAPPLDCARGGTGWRCTLAEAGRVTGLIRGLTLVAAFERQ